MPKISGEEAFLLKKASVAVKQLIRKGEAFVTGKSETDRVVRQAPMDEAGKQIHFGQAFKEDKPVLKAC